MAQALRSHHHPSSRICFPPAAVTSHSHELAIRAWRRIWCRSFWVP